MTSWCTFCHNLKCKTWCLQNHGKPHGNLLNGNLSHCKSINHSAQNQYWWPTVDRWHTSSNKNNVRFLRKTLLFFLFRKQKLQWKHFLRNVWNAREHFFRRISKSKHAGRHEIEIILRKISNINLSVKYNTYKLHRLNATCFQLIMKNRLAEFKLQLHFCTVFAQYKYHR